MPLYNPPIAERIQKRFDIGVTTIYVGTAPLGVASSATGWTIKKITLVAGNPTQEQWTGDGTAVWDNRSVESFS